jgi:hypothetical protein
MNLVLLLVVVLEFCIGFCAWLSPQSLRAVAARLLTRADILDLVRTEEQRRLQFWTAQLDSFPRSEQGISTGPTDRKRRESGLSVLAANDRL